MSLWRDVENALSVYTDSLRCAAVNLDFVSLGSIVFAELR